jgi:uncharacterized protein YuzE
MDKLKVHYEPETELLSIFWWEPCPDQLGIELDEDIVLFIDPDTDNVLGIELIGFKKGDFRLQRLSAIEGTEGISSVMLGYLKTLDPLLSLPTRDYDLEFHRSGSLVSS